MDPAQRSLVFFKIFDLAFFAPGAVVGVTAAGIWWSDLNTFLGDGNLGVAGGILLSLAVLVVVYVAGLVIFSIAWELFRWGRRARSKSRDPRALSPCGKRGWPAMPLLFDEAVRTELILYFWYLRATCLSVALAVLGSGIALACHSGDVCKGFWIFTGAAFLSVVLWWKGLGYHKAFERSLAPRAQKLQALVDAPDFTWTDD